MGAGSSSAARVSPETPQSNDQRRQSINPESHNERNNTQNTVYFTKEAASENPPSPPPFSALPDDKHHEKKSPAAASKTVSEVTDPTTNPQSVSDATAKEAGTIVDKVSDIIFGEDPDMGISKGFIVENNVKFDLSIPTSAAGAAVTVLKLVIFLVQQHITRGKMFKAMQTRVLIIEPSVLSLRKRDASTLEAALPAIKSLCVILVDYKNFAVHLSKKPEGFFSKAVTFFRATSDLDNLEHFDKRFTRALADLSVPLQTDQLALLEAQRTNLNAIAADLDRIFSKLDETKVLAISKRVLVNEEALSFWMDCLPDKFQVVVKEFVAGLFMWLTETKGMTVTRSQVSQLAALVNLSDGEEEEGGDEFIEARECNLLFEALPFDYVEKGIVASKASVAAYVEEKRRKDKKRLEDARTRVSVKLEAVSETSEHSNAEKSFVAEAGEKTVVRFLCEAQTIDGTGNVIRRSDVQSVYIAEDGVLHVFGLDSVSRAEVAWRGQLYVDESFTLDVPGGEDGAVASASGLFRGNAFASQCVLEGGRLQCIFLRLYGMVRWEGYYDCHWGRENMFFFIEERRQADGSCVVHGLSHDPTGVAIWSGNFNAEGTQARFLKQYLAAHFVSYEGEITINSATGLRSINGQWKIEDSENSRDAFCLWELRP